jgi:hypothetical protein
LLTTAETTLDAEGTAAVREEGGEMFQTPQVSRSHELVRKVRYEIREPDVAYVSTVSSGFAFMVFANGIPGRLTTVTSY